MDTEKLKSGPLTRSEALKGNSRKVFEHNYTKIIGNIYLRNDQLENPLNIAEALLARYPAGTLRGFAALAHRGYSLLDQKWVPVISVGREASHITVSHGKVLRQKQPEIFYTGDKKTVSDVQAIIDILEMPETWERKRGHSFEQKIALLDHLIRQNRHLEEEIAASSQLKPYSEWISMMAESRPESIVRVRIKQAGIVGFIPQVPVRGMSKTYYVDLGNPLLRVALEYQGAVHFHGSVERAADSERQNEIRGSGWIIIEVTWEDLWMRDRWKMILQRIWREVNARQLARKGRLPQLTPLKELKATPGNR